MWPFNKKQSEKDEQFIKDTFGKYLNEDVMSTILDESYKINELREVKVNYVLVLVRDTAEKTPELIERAVNIIQKQEGIIDTITSLYISVLFGAMADQNNAGDNRLNLVKELTSQLPTDLAIVHGEATCRVGILGSSQRMSYSAIIPGFKKKLNKLSSLEYGQQVEIMEENV